VAKRTRDRLESVRVLEQNPLEVVSLQHEESRLSESHNGRSTSTTREQGNLAEKIPAPEPPKGFRWIVVALHLELSRNNDKKLVARLTALTYDFTFGELSHTE
jgi:hypothetical protein